MQNLPTFNPTNYVQLGFGVVFYACVILATFMSAAAIYVLVRRGQHRTLCLTIAIVYGLFFLTLVGQGIHILSSIK